MKAGGDPPGTQLGQTIDDVRSAVTLDNAEFTVLETDALE
jgi:hypothetical protein